jgi:spermidine/putrescine-binding protein
VKKNVFFVIALASALFAAGCGNRQRLTIYTWDEMFPQEILKGFEKETGIRVNYVNFDTDETMLMRLQAAKGAEYDLVIADDYIIERVIKEGLAQKLDKSRLSNYQNINPIYQKQFYDKNDDYTVPYGAGVQTIVYNPQDIGFDIFGYSELWNPELVNSVGLIGNFRVINGMALKVLGQSYNTKDLDVIRDAGTRLRQLAPNVRLIRDDRLEEELVSGEISVAVMYTSQVTMAMLAKPELKMVFPREGIGFGVMAGFIPGNAPNADAAYAFLDYILDAQRGARCFEYLGYYSTNSASDALIDPESKELLTLPKGFNTDMEMIQNISPEAEDLHNIIWTEFRAAAGQ